MNIDSQIMVAAVVFLATLVVTKWALGNLVRRVMPPLMAMAPAGLAALGFFTDNALTSDLILAPYQALAITIPVTILLLPILATPHLIPNFGPISFQPTVRLESLDARSTGETVSGLLDLLQIIAIPSAALGAFLLLFPLILVILNALERRGRPLVGSSLSRNRYSLPTPGRGSRATTPGLPDDESQRHISVRRQAPTRRTTFTDRRGGPRWRLR